MKKLVILGGGESGVGAAILGKKLGYEVLLSDSGSVKGQYRKMLEEQEIEFEDLGHTFSKFESASLVIKSPGIPDTAPVIKYFKDLGISIISEIEFAGKETKAKKICITGSNGKTTTTTMIYQMLKNGGYNVGLGGNIGQSFALQVATENFDYYVLELSSFQLDSMYEFKADIAILLNITPDHLDRYNYKFENYVESKFRILQNMNASDTFIFWADDHAIQEYMNKHNYKINLMGFSSNSEMEIGGSKKGDSFIVQTALTGNFAMAIEELALRGQHNLYNAMATAICGKVIGVSNSEIHKTLSSFAEIEHRLEKICLVGGVLFINDSKATNVNSTWYALESMGKETVWIVGGVDKGNDYSCLDSLVAQKVSAIVCLGVDNTKIIDHFKGIVPVIKQAKSAIEAAKIGYALAKSKGTVLLSPACASFDLFDNYEDRGKQFKKAVLTL